MGGPRFIVGHGTASRVLKGEDAFLVEPLSASCTEAMVYMVCDGHMGLDAAQLVVDNTRQLLCDNLGSNLQAAPASPSFQEDVRRAICETFIDLENMWSGVGHLAGSTVTLALLWGSLLTVANVGDSTAVLDTGCSTLELTHSHRLQDNKAEQARLRKADCQLAQLGMHLQGPAKPGETGVGPLRTWPGGLCVSRSIGDIDAGPEVVPLPHVKQLLVPEAGCRIIMASDGLWDVMSTRKAVKLSRSETARSAASLLVQTVSSCTHGVQDDVSVIVVDVLPANGTATSFPRVVAAAAAAASAPQANGTTGGATPPPSPRSPRLMTTPRSRSGVSFGSGGLLSACFRGFAEPEEPDARDAEPGHGQLDFLSDVDGLLVYRHLLDTLVHVPPPAARTLGGAGEDSMLREFTLHNMSHLRPAGSSTPPSPSGSVHRHPSSCPSTPSGDSGSNMGRRSRLMETQHDSSVEHTEVIELKAGALSGREAAPPTLATSKRLL